jgi:hypothetical protein
MGSPVYTVDLAHPPRHPDRVEEDLQSAWQNVRNSPSLRLLKVIHGYGSSGKGGSTLTVTRNWAYTQRTRFRAIIPGEDYTLFHPSTQELRKELGPFDDPDLAHGNKGVLVIWVW